MPTQYWVATFIGGYSGDVKMLGFDNSGGASFHADTVLGGDFYRRLLGRCQYSLVFVPREMSRWFDFVSSGDVRMVWFR